MKYVEDFPVGVRRKLGTTSLDEASIIGFATEFDPQPFHVDKGAAEKGFYGGIIASGWHTCSATMRVMVDSFLSGAAALGSPGIDELRWLRPVRPGDILTVFSTIVDVKLSTSKPDRAVMTGKTEVENQHGDVVLTMLGKTMMLRRPEGVSS